MLKILENASYEELKEMFYDARGFYPEGFSKEELQEILDRWLKK